MKTKEIIQADGKVQMCKRNWWEIHRSGWQKHKDLWGRLWWIRFKWTKEQDLKNEV